MKICDYNLLNQISGGRGDHGRSSASGSHEGHSGGDHSNGGGHDHGGGHDNSGHDHGGNRSVSINAGYSEQSGAHFGAEWTISW